MKKSLLYLFILSLLLNVFTYMHFNKKSQYEQQRIETFKQESKSRKDSIALLHEQIRDANYFSLEANDNALEYFDDFDVDTLALEIRDEIYSLNEHPNGNPLTKYDPINGNKTIINKIKILNNRWIIADFSAGNIWGEVLIKYFVAEGKPTEYETIETFLHANTLN